MSLFCNANEENNQVAETIQQFFRAYSEGDLKKAYSCMSPYFQKRHPLKHFLIHERFQQDPGTLKEISSVQIDKVANTAIVEISLCFRDVSAVRLVALSRHSGVWSIDGDIFPE